MSHRVRLALVLSAMLLLGSLGGGVASADHIATGSPDGCTMPIIHAQTWGLEVTDDVKQFRVSKDGRRISFVCRFTDVRLTYPGEMLPWEHDGDYHVLTVPFRHTTDCWVDEGRYLGSGVFTLTPSGVGMLRCTVEQVAMR